ncbi:zinc finger MYND domain-containing protein 15 [Amia ocellicauda]|uniref:zinc finger MYND domain-containing protein 15 n=1 Tax=Amia ocellicauda TaxID=2972642 RepID=UPI003463BFE0
MPPLSLSFSPQCQAVLFCSPRCLGADGRSSPAELSHQRCCPQLAVFMKHGPPLADLPFTFTAEVTSPDLDMEHFLSCRGLDSGYWMQKSMLVRPANWELESQAEQSKHSTPGTQQPYGPLHKESEMLLCGCPRTPPALNAPLVSWLQYYEWRGLDLSSPVCVLLSPALTIYHIITCLVPRDFPDLNILKKQSLRIHFLEAERHYSTPLIFWELSALLPHVTFELLFVGEGLPQTCVDKQHQLLQIKGGRVTLLSFGPENRKAKKSIRVKGYRWTYDLFQGPKPDLVIGFRSDFCLSNSWMSILHRLQSLRVPAYFCESSELSCVSGQPVMAAATGGSLSSPSLNPFHCPLRITGTDHCLPCYSNAFIFHLVYKPPPQARREQQEQQQPPPPQAFPPGPQRRGDRVKMKQREKKQAGRNMPRRKK